MTAYMKEHASRLVAYLASLDTLYVLMLQMQTQCAVSMDVKNSTQENLQNKCNNLQLRNRTETCEEIQSKIIKSNSNPNLVKQNL